MKLCLVISILFAGSLGLAQLKEPKSDPSFDTAPPPKPMDDAAEVQLRPSSKASEEEVSMGEEVKPKRHILVPQTTPSSNFSVTRVRINEIKRAPKSFQLLSPPHNAVYTPGVITFSWKPLVHKKIKGVMLTVERMDGKRKYSKKTYKEKKLLDLSPGEYKWQVTSVKPQGLESRWRLFKIQEIKSHSLNELYHDKKTATKKPAPYADYIIDMDGDAEEVSPDVQIKADVAPVSPAAPTDRIPTSDPLPPPSWVKPK